MIYSAQTAQKDRSSNQQIDNSLPDGWSSTKLATVADSLTYGYTASATKGSNGPRFLRITDIQNGIVNWNSVPTCEIEEDDIRKYSLRSGDIVFARTGATTGKSFLIRSCPAAVFASYLIRLRPLPGINPAFLAHFFQTPDYRRFISDNVAGIAQPNCNATKLAELALPIPPASEQQRVVDAIEANLSRVSSARDHLSRVPAILKRFRQAVLAAACLGRLTEDWRIEHADIEPASELLQRMAQLRHGRPTRHSAEEQGTNSLSAPENLPDSWCWCRVEQIASVCLGGTPSRKEPRYWGGNVLWVSSGEVANCRISATREHITDEGLTNSNAKIYPKHSVLIAMIGEGKTRGQSAILDIDAATNQNVAGLLFDTKDINPDYVWYWAMSEYETNRAIGRGGSQPALNGEKVRGLMFALPPTLEQIEIVRRVKVLLDRADDLESRLRRATFYVHQLNQSILAKAFRGELVPTEAELARREGRNYEHASVLLERIKKERETETASKSTKAKRTKKASLAAVKG